MSKRNRAWRRFQAYKAEKKLLKYNLNFYFLCYGDKTDQEIRELSKDHAKRFKDNPKNCSCHYYGNPRKFFGESTLQERRFNDISNSQD